MIENINFGARETLISIKLVGKLTIERCENKRGREGFGSHQAIVKRLANSGGVFGVQKESIERREKGVFHLLSTELTTL